MNKQTIFNIIIALVLSVFFLVIGAYIVIPVQNYGICKHCIETNWTDVVRGELIYNCSDFTPEERLKCEEFVKNYEEK